MIELHFPPGWKHPDVHAYVKTRKWSVVSVTIGHWYNCMEFWIWS